MADPRTSHLRDAAQLLAYAAERLLRADALSPASDQRARKLLAHVQDCGECACGLAEAMERNAAKVGNGEGEVAA